MPRASGSRPPTQPDFKVERQHMLAGRARVVGIDEAGIGPWAGPVVAAAVCLDPLHLPIGVRDSKTLTAARREDCFAAILRLAHVGVGVADVARIDRDNVLRASQWAMAQAVAKLDFVPDLALVDGKHAPKLSCSVAAMVDGDALILSIAAASIVAKVTRDRIMVELSALHPGYGFDKHKGYGTAEHRAAIARLGVIAAHRRSFRPIQEAIAAAMAETTGPPLTHGAAKLE